MKKFLLFVFCAVTAIAERAQAHDFEVDGIYYTYLTVKTVSVSYQGISFKEYSNEYTGNVVIPSSVTYNGTTYSVTSIGSSAFYSCDGLTSITIPNSVTSIDSYAFYYCTGLTNIEIPSSVTSIDSYAFYYCTGLTSIEIPSSVTSIDSYAFYYCTGLTSIEIPSSVTRIGSNAFSLVKNIIYSGSAEGSPWGALTVNGIVDGDFVYSDAEKTHLTAYTGSGGDVVVPSSVTSIGEDAFYGCTGLTNIEIPSSVTRIGYDAFRNCTGLTSIEIPSSVTSIGNSAFYHVKNIIYSGSAEGRPWSALTVNGVVDGDFIYSDAEKTHLTVYIGSGGDVVVPSSVTSIDSYAFEYCTGLTSVEIPSSVTSIGDYAFFYCTGLTSVEIPNSMTSIGDHAFYYCKGLTSITIPSSVTSIGNLAFRNCTGLTSIEIPSSVTSIGSSAFSSCTGLTSIEIPSSVTSIGSSAFSNCTGLTSIEIPSSVTSIGSNAFSRVKNVIYSGSAEGSPWGALTVNGIVDGDFVYSDAEKTQLTAYIGSGGDVVVPNRVTSIGNDAFRDCWGLTSVEIPSSVTSIGDYAFRDCWGLTSVEIPSSVTSIGDYAFSGCTGLTSIEIPSSVTSIGNSAFRGCTGLTSIEIPSSVTSIGGSAFYGCTGLTSIEIPSSVTSIGNSAFRGCTGLTSVTALNPTPVSIASSVFSNRANATLYVPTGSKAAYEAADYWKEFKEIVEIEVFDGNYSDLDDFDNVVYMESFRTDPGEEIELPILLKNQTAGDISGFEFYLHLPTGISPVLDDEGFPIVTLSTERTTTRKHTIYGDLESNGSIHIYASASRSTYSFSGSDGEVATISLKVADNMENGIYPISLRDISMTSLSSEDPFTVSRYYLSAQIGTLTFNINDGEALAYNQTETHDELVYTRTFSSAEKWQALYVPFSIPIDTLDKYGLQVAELNDTHMYDTDEDGEFDQTTLEFLYLKRGATEPNYPYLIRAASAGDVTLTMTDVEVKATEETEIECSTTRVVFKIRGTYAGISGAVMYANNYYAMGGGTLVRMANADSGLKPQRWYLSVENKDGSPVEYFAATMRIAIDGIEIEESETAISEVNAIGQKQDEIYMLDGRKLNGTAALKSGLYVKNHKKLFVR